MHEFLIRRALALALALAQKALALALALTQTVQLQTVFHSRRTFRRTFGDRGGKSSAFILTLRFGRREAASFGTCFEPKICRGEQKSRKLNSFFAKRFAGCFKTCSKIVHFQKILDGTRIICDRGD